MSASENHFSRLWAIGVLVLMAVTYPLWTPAFVSGRWFPQVGLIDLPGSLKLVLSIAGLLAAVGCLAGNALNSNSNHRRKLWAGVSIGLLTLVIADQHRLQPWCYQTMAYGVLFACCQWRETRFWMTLLTASIYLFSAAGKLDFQFTHTVGQQMVATALAWFSAGNFEHGLTSKIALSLPITELLIGVLVAVPRTRRYGGFAAIAMHISLIGLLGPWSLNHSFGVLCWNVLLAVQIWVLFVRSDGHVEAESSDAASLSKARHPVLPWLARVLLIGMLIAPLSERFGYWDHWTSWSLYSPHTSRAVIQVHHSAMDQLPPEVRPYLDDLDGDGWGELHLDDWSIEDRLVPIYPQARYQLAVADRLADRFKLDKAIRVELRSASDRWNGQRKSTYLIGANEVKQAMNRYWFPLND
ncbi:hypothetical protein LOC67_07310 [Stieleria sp. JC731]|uniref:hypothetical protein n=1 Tax=Pirellulaceae TaxID=2691357 RepID=UPI001E31D6DD|nr:hypothetical protein [Stieleria sp. JC731]MCC9600365.1 hypothetical protein [Stieleria sp. JC731]